MEEARWRSARQREGSHGKSPLINSCRQAKNTNSTFTLLVISAVIHFRLVDI